MSRNRPQTFEEWLAKVNLLNKFNFVSSVTQNLQGKASNSVPVLKRSYILYSVSSRSFDAQDSNGRYVRLFLFGKGCDDGFHLFGFLDDSEDDENHAADVIEFNQEQKASSSQKIEILHLVEPLLMLERYSREECDKLIEIINSRVVDYAGPSMIHSRTNNETEAIMEARKWVADNKSRSGKKSDLDNGLYALKYIITPQAAEEEGSPVEVAKSYMGTRPPWASPLRRDNSASPSPLTELFKEKTPYSSDGGISFKGSYLSAGSWNIHDEICKVQSKATKDLLNNHRSMKLLEHSVENNILETSKPVDEIMEPTVEDKEKEMRGHSEGNGIECGNGMVDEDCILLTESGDIPGVNNSQDSFNNDQNLGGKADEKNVVVTRGSRNSRTGRGRGK